VASIAAGSFHSIFINKNGDLYVMGDNDYGQLGNDSTSYVMTPVKIDTNVSEISAGAYYSLYLKKNGDLYAMGRNNYGQLGDGTTTNSLIPILIAKGVEKIAAGDAHTLFLTNRISPYSPTDERGAKWSDTWGWIDDTYYPWVWCYTYGNWFYVYDNLAADVEECHWIAYYTPDCSDYGWGYVYPEIGWWCFTSDMKASWVNFGEALPH
jgi:hypothetical protein